MNQLVLGVDVCHYICKCSLNIYSLYYQAFVIDSLISTLGKCFLIPCHMKVEGYYGIPQGGCLFLHISLLDNSSYSFHWITLKLGGQIDHEVVHCILFRGYSTPNFDRVPIFFEDFPDLTLFQDNSNSFYLIRLKHSGKLDYEVIQRIFFRGYSTPNFDEVIFKHDFISSSLL